ncbi:MAG: zinc ribbon domain-containing protein [Dehalococcoidia bacterium]|nr:zinc ribbon domain-containing protein [Dehalococcoidia bacterium]
MFSLVSLGFFLLVFLLCLILPILIGIFVYRDAKSRDMNALMWLLIVIVAPMFIGLIIYFIVRSNYSNLKCPSCQAPVSEQYLACPSCGIKLKASCANCGAHIQSGWSVCPNCASLLSNERLDYSQPIARSGKIPSRALIAVLIILPLIILVPLGIGFALRSSAGVDTVTLSSLQSTNNYSYHPEVTAWLQECTDTSKIYALRSVSIDKWVEYLFYMPDHKMYFESYSSTKTNETIKFISATEIEPYGQQFFAVIQAKYNGSPETIDITVWVSGEAIPCEVTEGNYFMVPVITVIQR